MGESKRTIFKRTCISNYQFYQVLDTLNNTCVLLEDCPCPDCDPLPANCLVIIPPSATEECGCNTCGGNYMNN